MWKMEPNEILLSRAGGGNTNGNTGEGFIDRSKVRILLCDNELKSSEEVFNLLCKCSYQVTSVRSPRQVIDALNAEGPDIDIILSEVDLPMAKGFKMLKYIMRDKDLRRIPVIMMSAQDEVALVVKCLRLGAADYLVKPLRTNELLNLWTHMWRRRRMLGLAEKNIMFDLVHSDPSDANTNSTTLFSDDTDDNKSRKTSNPDNFLDISPENESNVIIPHGLVNTPVINLSDDPPNVPEIIEQQRGKMAFGPKKSELRIGQSSAFFTYVKSTILGTTTHHIDDVTTPLLENNLSLPSQPITTINLTDETTTQYVHVDEKVTENTHHTNAPENNYNYNYNHNHNHPDISTYNPYSPYPYYHLSGPMMMSSMYQQSQYNHIPPHHMQGMGSYPYYPINLFQPGQMPAGMHNQWPVNDSNSDVKVHKLDRREAALLKFRQKRKERCFDKKIRYVNRKKLAERRPRVRGQFVRKINGIDVDLNGQPTCNDFDEDDDDDDVEEEDDDDDDRVGGDSSPENNYSGFHS